MSSADVRCSFAAVTPCCGTRATSRSPRALASTTPSIQTHLRDLVIVGAGPAGLAAAVYGASEASILVLESNAWRPSRFELEGSAISGFPGISGLELTGRAYAQAEVRRRDPDREGGAKLSCDQASRCRWTMGRASRTLR